MADSDVHEAIQLEADIDALVSPNVSRLWRAMHGYTAEATGAVATHRALSVVLADPGNVYAMNTAVAEGYQIAETVQGELRVFEVTTAGTTGGNPFSDYQIILTPLGETTTGPVTWRYLGIVGQVSWVQAPLLPGVTVDGDGFHVAANDPAGEAATFFQLLPGLADSGNAWEALSVLSEANYRISATVDGALRVFELVGAGTTGANEPAWVIGSVGQTTPDGSVTWAYRGIVGGPDTDRPVFVANTAGDSDWFLDINNGSGFRFNISEDGVPVEGAGQTEMTTDGFKVSVGAATFEINYDPFFVRLLGLPTTDPGLGFGGCLWVDPADRTLKVSEGV